MSLQQTLKKNNFLSMNPSIKKNLKKKTVVDALKKNLHS